MKYHLLTYWVTLANIRGIDTTRKNRIYSSYFDLCNQSKEDAIVRLFEDEESWSSQLVKSEIDIFKNAKASMPNTAFMVESLLAQHYAIIPITSEEYPQLMKKRLKWNSPIVIYAKGNISLLNQDSVAIVGSRKAKDISLEFTKAQAAKATKEGKVVVSGGAKGVDTQALESALENNGKSIIVLPQGITTFSSGFKKYYRQLIKGNVLVISQFEPKAGWNAGLAMARNSTIYALGASIIVAESGYDGGTWEGALNGLRKEWPVYVRWTNQDEDNANRTLITEHKAVAIDLDGNVVNSVEDEKKSQEDELKKAIIDILEKYGPMTSKEIIKNVGSDMTDPKMKSYLREQMKDVVYEIPGKKPIHFGLCKPKDGIIDFSD